MADREHQEWLANRAAHREDVRERGRIRAERSRGSASAADDRAPSAEEPRGFDPVLGL